ncbi:hypothetical protein BaRGS_00040308 [Batillaria attramentaria]|uniref:ISXO2-like transposase domain-containing protein n=1 Tax=Batillaria attramentaria TaxID=370345 RepID=A0ABD0J180_9CAEN
MSSLGFGACGEGIKLLLFPVDTRDANTLIPILQHHVAPGATIYTDGYRAYGNLNELGYRHFNVIHRAGFVKIYENKETAEQVTVHTHQIEGAWAIAKMKLKSMRGTRASQFESHLAEIVYRNWISVHKTSLNAQFFRHLTDVYPLVRKPVLQAPVPFFGSWAAECSTRQELDDIVVSHTEPEAPLSSDSAGRHVVAEQSTDSNPPKPGERRETEGFEDWRFELSLPAESQSPKPSCSKAGRSKTAVKAKKLLCALKGLGFASQSCVPRKKRTFVQDFDSDSDSDFTSPPPWRWKQN